MKVLSLFDGISVGRLALSNIGVKVDQYYASEIDKNAISISKNNWPEIIRIGDVSKVSFKDGVLYTENGNFNVGHIDLLLAGSPCQGFSFAGKQLNFEDPRSKLYFEFSRLLKEVQPTNFLLENVKMKKEFEDIITQDLNRAPVKINSRAFSAQNRLRYYWTDLPVIELSSDIPAPNLLSILEDNDCVGVYTIPRGYNKGGIGQMEKMPCITTSSWQHNFFVAKADGTKRKFSVAECELAQCLPVGYTEGVSENARYVAIGNSWTASVIQHLMSSLPMKQAIRSVMQDISQLQNLPEETK